MEIFLIYDKAYWSLDLEGIYPICLPDENENEHYHFSSKLKNPKNNKWFENICYFETVNNHENMLCAWLSGCIYYESLDDATIVRDCTSLLRKLLNNSDFPEPISVIR